MRLAAAPVTCHRIVRLPSRRALDPAHVALRVTPATLSVNVTPPRCRWGFVVVLSSLSSLLALNRTVGVVLISVLFFGLGEQLWSPFLPAYLEAETNSGGASSMGGVSFAALLAIGVYACLRNLFEAACYVGGGELTARLGDRGSLILFGLITVGGYALFLTTTAPALAIIAALLILGWEPLSVPVTFTTVGTTVTKMSQGMAFALQSIQKRLPRIFGPAIAGLVLAAAARHHGSADLGYITAVRWLVGASFFLAVGSLVMQIVWMPRRPAPPRSSRALTIVSTLHPALRRLLVAEVFTRWCDWLVREFVVLYLLAVRGTDAATVGLLFALQNLVALLTYLPIGRMTAVVGLQPFIGLTFIFFALFPLALALAPDGYGLIIAFVVWGLREIGEPARKALIVSLLPEAVRAQGVGLYWGIRGVAICWASLVGALVWFWLGPHALLYLAFAFGCAGAAVFYVCVREPSAMPKSSTTSIESLTDATLR
jgi:MFS family permease